MNMAETKQWYALYTRPKWEKRVAELLTKRKVEVYCPLNRARGNDRRKTVQEPLFQSLIFVNTTPSQHARIREVEGVVNFVHWLSLPAIVRQEEIDTIRKFLTEYDRVSLEKTSVNLNDRVKIINGPLMMWEGSIVEIRTNTVKIILPSLGYALVAEIRKEHAEPLRPMQVELEKKAV